MLSIVVGGGLLGCQHIMINEEAKISITKPLGTTQCSETDPNVELKKLKQGLEQAQIKVYAAEIGTDGLSRIALCGTADGKIALFDIDQSALPKAQNLGYKKVVMN